MQQSITHEGVLNPISGCLTSTSAFMVPLSSRAFRWSSDETFSLYQLWLLHQGKVIRYAPIDLVDVKGH